MPNLVASAVEAALDRLGIQHRDVPYGSGVLCFCTIPVNGLTFDVWYANNGMIRIWRFVDTAPASKAGTRWEYRNPNHPDAVAGIEVTEEGDVNFYAEQNLDGTDSRSAARIESMIRGFITIITDGFPAFGL